MRVEAAGVKEQSFLDCLTSCELCARRCKVDRLSGKLGFCHSGKEPIISSATLHFGEEPFISGRNGSGTIFFANCSLRCVYCQNYQISQEGLGYSVSVDRLANIMLELQGQKAHNINLVTPTHFVPQILEALRIAKRKGLNIPIVYNTSGYETLETLEMLRGWVDIYLPDIKYGDNENAVKYSSAPSYVEVNKAAIFEMFRQVGNLKIINGVARSGMLVRHLILPNNVAGSYEVLRFLASLSKDIWVALMAQYYPCYRASKFPELDRKIKSVEYNDVLRYAKQLGLHNLLVQELSSSEMFLPDFRKEMPFI